MFEANFIEWDVLGTNYGLSGFTYQGSITPRQSQPQWKSATSSVWETVEMKKILTAHISSKNNIVKPSTKLVYGQMRHYPLSNILFNTYDDK